MLIRFALTIADLKPLVDLDKFVLLLTELLRAHRFGMHLLVMERALANYLASSPHISTQDRAILHRIQSDFTQNGDLHERAMIYLEITPPRAKIEYQSNCVTVPVDQLDVEMISTPALLLTEDTNSDGEIVEFIIKNVRDVVGVPISRFKREHGGGTSIIKRVHKAMLARELGACLLDTDCITPYSHVNALVKEAEELSKNDLVASFFHTATTLS